MVEINGINYTLNPDKLARHLWLNENLKTKVIGGNAKYRSVTYRECLRIANSINAELKGLLEVIK